MEITVPIQCVELHGADGLLSWMQAARPTKRHVNRPRYKTNTWGILMNRNDTCIADCNRTKQAMFLGLRGSSVLPARSLSQSGSPGTEHDHVSRNTGRRFDTTYSSCTLDVVQYILSGRELRQGVDTWFAPRHLSNNA